MKTFIHLIQHPDIPELERQANLWALKHDVEISDYQLKDAPYGLLVITYKADQPVERKKPWVKD